MRPPPSRVHALAARCARLEMRLACERSDARADDLSAELVATRDALDDALDAEAGVALPIDTEGDSFP